MGSEAWQRSAQDRKLLQLLLSPETLCVGKIGSPLRRTLCVGKIPSPPRRDLCVDTIHPRPRRYLCVEEIGSGRSWAATNWRRGKKFLRPAKVARPFSPAIETWLTIAQPAENWSGWHWHLLTLAKRVLKPQDKNLLGTKSEYAKLGIDTAENEPTDKMRIWELVHAPNNCL